MKKKLEKQLRAEFSYLSPDITRAVVWFICGNKTFEQTYHDLIVEAEMESFSKELQDVLVYETLLSVGRKTCQAGETVEFFKKTIRETVLEVNARRQADQAQTRENSQSYQDEGVHKKRKFDHEEQTDGHENRPCTPMKK